MLKKVKAWFKNLWEYIKATFFNPEFRTECGNTILYFNRMKEYSYTGNLKNVLIGLLTIGVIILGIVGLLKLPAKTDVEMLKEEQDYIRRYILPIEIDGCEYLFYYNSPHFSLTHKGNCNNPIHKRE